MQVTPEDIAATKPDCRGAAALLAQAQSIAVGKANNEVGRVFALSILAGMMIGSGALFMLIVKGDPTLPFAARNRRKNSL